MAQPLEFKAYKVQEDGQAPKGLQENDFVVTNGGLYVIRRVLSNGDYDSVLVDSETTTYNYRGQYLVAPSREMVNNYTEKFNMIDNYIYLYNLDKFIVLPEFPDSVQDVMSASYSEATPLGRSAPIYSYKNSGPRTLQINFNLHRELLKMINKNVNSSVSLGLTDDYVDILIKYIQASVLPTYESAKKMVNPPIVAVRFGNDLFIKGVINGPVGVTYNYPILSNGKYAMVSISFTISEIDPFDAESVSKAGSFRGMNTTLERAWSNYYNSYYNEEQNTIVV